MATIILTPEQSMQFEEGGWPEQRLVETLCEDLERQHICEAVTILTDTGAVAFSLTPAGGRPC